MATYRSESQRKRVEELLRKNNEKTATVDNSSGNPVSSGSSGQQEQYNSRIFRSADQQRRVESILESNGYSVSNIWNAYNERRNKTASDLANRYNALTESYKNGNVFTSDKGQFQKSVDTLIRDFKNFGAKNGQEYIDSLEYLKQNYDTDRLRSQTASGLLSSDEAETLRRTRNDYQTQLDALLDLDKKNRGPDSIYAEIQGVERTQEAADRQKSIQDLQGKIGDIDSILNIYDRVDAFKADSTDKYAAQDGAYTARRDWNSRRSSREQDSADKLSDLRTGTPYAARENGVSSAHAYAAGLNGNEDNALVGKAMAYDKSDSAQELDRLDDYLTWFENLSEDDQSLILKGLKTPQELSNVSEENDVTSRPYGSNRHWEYMTQDEIKAVYQIANTEGADAAVEYLDNLQLTLDRRNTLSVEETIRTGAENIPVGLNMLEGVLSVPAQLISGPVSFVGNALDKIQGKEWNPYSNANSLLNQISTVRSAASQDIYQTIAGDGDNKYMNALGELASNAYQAGLSTLDSLAGMYTMGSAYTVTMGMGAASSRMRELYESGASDEELYIGSIGSGILEALFEKVSLDTFADQWLKNNPEKFIKKMLIQAGVEGSEEVFTELGNMILDAVNRGVNSDHSRRVRELMNDSENPITREEAEQKAAAEDAMDVFWAGFGGFLSGGLSSVGGAVAENVNNRAYGRSIAETGNPSDVVSDALELRQDDSTAARLSQRMESGSFGRKGSDYSALARVAQQNTADLLKKDTASVEAAIRDRASSIGVRGDADALARAIRKSVTGESLSMTDRYALAQNRSAADKISEEIFSAAENKTEDNAWVSNISTYTAMYPGTFGTKETEAGKSARSQMEESVKSIFGKQAPLVMSLYHQGQNRSAYIEEFTKVYRAGQEGVSLDSVLDNRVLTGKQAEAAYSIGKDSVGRESFDYGSQSDGQSIRKSDNTPVNITGFSDIGDTVSLSTDDGGTVNVEDVSFGSYGQARLYRVLSGMGIDAEQANEFLEAAGSSRLSDSAFAVALNDAYISGRSGVSLANISQDAVSMRLDEKTRKAAWEVGRAAAEGNDARKQATIDRGTHGKRDGGLVMEDSAKRIRNLNKQQQSAMDAANVLSAMGIPVTVFASTKADREANMENGSIRLSDGSIRVDLNAGDDGRGVMAYALSHEFTHFVEEMSSEKFRTFTDILFAEVGKTGEDVDGLIRGKMAMLRAIPENKGKSENELTDLARSEVVAEMMETAFSDTDIISRISSRLQQTDRSLWGRIKNFLKGLVEKLKAAYKDMQPDSSIARLASETIQNSEAILNAYADAAADAVVNYNLQDEQKNTDVGWTQFMVRNVNGEQVVWIENSGLNNKQLRDYQQIANYIANHVGEVYTIIESGSKVYLGKDLPSEYVHSKYTTYLRNTDKTTLKAKNRAIDGFGEMIEIATNRRWEKTRHTNSKDAAYGMYRYDSKFAFPVKNSDGKNIGVRAYDVELIIRNASDGKKYLYDIVNIKENTANVLELQKMESRNGSVSTAAQGGASSGRVPQSNGNVNGNNPKSSRNSSQRDAEYMELAKDPEKNREQLSRMVEQAAKNAGYTRLFYHGSKKGGGFTVFKDWQYFTENRKYAERYAQRGNEGSLYTTFVKMENPFDTRIDSVRKLFEQARQEYGMGELQENGLPDWTDGYDIADYIDDNNLSFDSIVLDEGGDMVDGKPVSRGLSYVIRDSSQVKSSDPVTYDDNGNVIPLSQRFDSGKEDIRYSSRNVQETKDLIAVHNLSEEKLLKSLSLGGLPMPSIAIMRATDGHSNFGDISLVFGKDTIDPQFFRSNKVYSGDAWTPTYPQVEYKASEKVLKKVKDKISGIVPYTVQKELGSLMFDTDNVTNNLNRNGGSMVEAYKNNDAMKYAYLKDTGSDISLPMKEAPLYRYGDVSNESVSYFAGKLVNGLQTVEHYRNMSAGEMLKDNALKEAVADALNFDVLRTLEPGSDEYSLYERNPVFHADDVSFSDIDSYLSASKKLFTTGIQQTVDSNKAKEQIRNAVDQSAYERWLEDLFSGVVEKEGIRNNKEPFTSSGNRRSFEALHYENTLENVIKAMRETGDKGIGFGGGSIFGASTTEFSSIDEIKSAKGRLQKLSDEEYQKIKQGFADRFFELASSLPKNTSSFSAMDDAANMLIEAVAKYKTKSGMANYLRRESQGWAKYSDYVLDDLLDLVRDIRSMPTGYFEAKPQRAVGFDEVKMVIVPDNVSQNLIGELENRGIPYQTYKAGDEEQRRRIVQDLDDVRFSSRTQQEKALQKVEAENERLKTDVEYLKKLVQIQKAGNKDFTLDRNSVKRQAVSLMRQNNAKGDSSELAEMLDGVYRYVGTDTEITWEGFREKAEEAADWLMEHRVKERDRYAQEVLDFMAKRRIRLDDSQIAEAKYQFGSLNEFRKAIKGTVVLDRNANTSLDQFWQEAAGRFPGQFDSETTSTDQVSQLAYLVQDLMESQSTEEAERAYYADEEQAQLVRQIYDGYWNVQPVKSVSDQAAKQIDQLKAEHREAIRSLKQAQAEAMRDFRKEAKAALEEYRRQRDVEAKAMKAVYESERKQVELSYKKEMNNLRETYTGNLGLYQDEFLNVLNSMDGLNEKTIPEIRKRLRESAEQFSGKDKDALQARMQEYGRLLDGYSDSRDIDKLKETIQEKNAQAKAKVESAEKTEIRGKTQRVLNQLNRMLLNPSKNLYVPDSLQNAVALAMQAANQLQQEGLDETIERVLARYEERLSYLRKDPVKNREKIQETERKLAKTLERKNVTVRGSLLNLQNAYSELIKNNEGRFTDEYNDGILNLLDSALSAVGETRGNNLSKDQLQAVYEAYKGILTAIRSQNKMFASNLKKGYEENARAVYSELEVLPSKSSAGGEYRKAMESQSWNNMIPVYAFDRLGSQTMSRLFGNLRHGEDVWQQDFEKARAYAMGTMDKYHYDGWEDSVVELESSTGKKFTLNLEERLSLYAYSKREQALYHLTNGGIVLNETKRTVKNALGVRTEQVFNDSHAYNLKADDVLAIRDGRNILGLTTEQMAFADEMQEYLSTVCAEQNNEVSRALYGVSIAKEKYYWPIKVSGIFSERARQSQENPVNRQKNAAHMKATVKKASNPIELSGFMETWASHVNNTAMYHAFTLPMEDFFRVYNWKTGNGADNETTGIRQMILEKHGKAAVDYIDQFLKDLNGGLRADPRESAQNLLLSRFKKSAVAFSLSVAIQQPSAIGRAFAVIDPKYFVGTKVSGIKGLDETWNVMQKYAPVVGLKDIGRFDMGTGKSTIDLLTGQADKGFMAKLDNFSGSLPELMDKVTWCSIWEAAKRQTKAENPNLSGEDLLTAAGNLFTECITRTQVYDSVFARSGNMRSKTNTMKMLTSFMAEPTVTANMALSAVRDAKAGSWNTAGKKLASIGTAVILNSILASLVYASRDDDEEKTWVEKYLKSLSAELIDGVNPLGYIPGVKDIFSIFQGYDVERSDMSLWAALAKTVTKFSKAWKSYSETDEDDVEARREALKEAGKASVDMAAGILNLFGIPLKNVLREIRAAGNVIDGIRNPKQADSSTYGYAIWQGLNEYLPEILRKSDGKSQQLYKAISSGSEAWIGRMRESYEDEKSYQTAVVSSLMKNDPRIRRAAKAIAAGNDDTAQQLIDAIKAEKRFTEDQVDSTIEKQLKKLPGASYDDLLSGVRAGEDVSGEMEDLARYGYSETQMLNNVKSAIQEWYQSEEISKQEAISKLQKYFWYTNPEASEIIQKWTAKIVTGTDFSEIKDLYLDCEITKSKAIDMYVRYGGYDRDDAEKIITKWGSEIDLNISYEELPMAYKRGKITESTLLNALMLYGGLDKEAATEKVAAYKWQKTHPGYDLEFSEIQKYTETIKEIGGSLESMGISPDVFQKYSSLYSQCKGENKREQVLSMIDSLPITSSQKDALYYASGYSKNTIRKTPWH